MKGCNRCGEPKPPGRGRKFCSPECRDAGPATGVRHCPDCDEDRLVPVQMREKAVYCERCLKQRARQQAKRHYQANRERVLADVATYRRTHAEELRAKKREHYQRNREKIRAQQSAYYRETRDAAQERSRRWYEANRDKHRESARRYREAHREEVRARNRRWYDAIMADPERAEERRELARMDARLRAEKNGQPMPPVPRPVYLKRYGRGHQGHGHERIDAAPLVPHLREISNVKGWTKGLDIDASTVYAILHGELQQITIRDADVLSVALGLPLRFIYGADAA